MNSELWKLVSTYEVLLELTNSKRPARVEVFKSTNGTSRYRARIWVQDTYNQYPTFLNLGPQGQDLHHTHSSDELNKEITSLVVEDPAFIEGKEFESESEFVKTLMERIAWYQGVLNER